MLAILTIGAGLFVLGFFLIVNTNVQRLTERWGEAAEFAVYLRDDVTPEQLRGGAGADRRERSSAGRQLRLEGAGRRALRPRLPDLGATAGRLERNPFPASIDVRLRPDVRTAEEAVDALARALSTQAGVSDVRYDRRWLSRLNGVITFVRSIGMIIVALLALASALTVANVVRLAAHARRDEIEIMQLVGAPLTYVRGPLVLEGRDAGRRRGDRGDRVAGRALCRRPRPLRCAVAEAVGLGAITFLPVELWLVLLLGGMLSGRSVA